MNGRGLSALGSVRGRRRVPSRPKLANILANILADILANLLANILANLLNSC